MRTKDLKINFRYLCGNIACMSVDSVNGEKVHNDINNEEAIILFNSLVGEKEGCKTVKTLLEENQELKKHCDIVEKKLCDEYSDMLDKRNKLFVENCKLKNQLSSKILQLETQQKEFINYLNNCIKELEKESLNKLQNTINLGIADVTKEILSKYKEIVGVENEN